MGSETSERIGDPAANAAAAPSDERNLPVEKVIAKDAGGHCGD